MPQHRLTESYVDNKQLLDQLLRIEQSFDIVGKSLMIGNRPAMLYFVDGFAKDDIFEKILEHWATVSIVSL